MTRILIVDDDPAMLRTLRINLAARDYIVELAYDGRTALQSVSDQPPDLILLDLGLPDLDGVSVLRQVRATSDLPVIVVSARQQADDIVEALDLGADDYVTKPFGMAELLARVRAALRHAGSLTPPDRVLTAGDLHLDFTERRATRSGEQVHLTPTEWRLLEVLTREPGRLVRQTELLQEVWGPSYHSETNYLRVYLAQLRKKLEAVPGHPRHLHTEPGVGHRFVV